jgi:hypothetical protein
MKRILIIVLFIILSRVALFSQVTVKNLDLIGNVREIKIDSILKISMSEFDSVILKTLTIPDITEDKSNCGSCSGGYYKSYLITNNSIIKSEFIRSSKCYDTDKCDTEVSFIYDKVLEKVLNYLNLDKNLIYLIWIRIDFDWGDNEKVYIDNNSTFKKFVIIRKRNR